MKNQSKPWIAITLLVLLPLLLLLPVLAEAQPIPLPSITFGLEQTDDPQEVSIALQILLLLTVLSLAPAIMVMMTSFTRLAIVFSLLRRALGTQQMPPNQIIIGLSLILTFFIMAPVFNQINREALQPYLEEEISREEAVTRGLSPVRQFMFAQTRKKDIALFMDISQSDKPHGLEDIPTMILLPSFVISELKTAFQMGFIIYIPFLIIDMVVASVLLSMGMMMLPPFMISFPFKLMLFVLVDGWGLLVGSMVKSFV